uniref:SEC-C metal-binding domain-containing protein n=1 Tax=Pandoraea pnomenusa TaxID=93220 RepID=UPI0033428CC4
WDLKGLETTLREEWQLDLPLQSRIEGSEEIDDEDILKEVMDAAEASYNAKVELVGRESFSGFERSVMLQSVDSNWREHLAALDHLRQGIHLRGYAQKNPKQEYKREAFELFAQLLETIKLEVTRVIMNVRIQSQEELEQATESLDDNAGGLINIEFKHDELETVGGEGEVDEDAGRPVVAALAQAAAGVAGTAGAADAGGELLPKVGRNDPCPCGSGKKFKHCHGKLS